MRRRIALAPAALVLACALQPSSLSAQLYPFESNLGFERTNSEFTNTVGAATGTFESTRNMGWLNVRTPLVGLLMMDRINDEFWWMDYHMFGLGMGRETSEEGDSRKLMRIRWEPGLQAVRRMDGTIRYLHGMVGAVLETSGEGAMSASGLDPLGFVRLEAHTYNWVGGVTVGTDDFLQAALYRGLGRGPFKVGVRFEQTGRGPDDGATRTLDRTLGVYIGTIMR